VTVNKKEMSMITLSVGSQNQRSRVARAVQRGFTLIEVMIVIVIIGLIAGAVSFGVVPKLKKAKIETAKMVVQKIANAAAASMGTSSACPKGLEELIASGDLSKSQMKDPWGTPYLFRCPGVKDPDGVDVTSNGPDKQPGTPDDINSWELQ
jgi:general secretion pathway protein G